MKMKGEQEEGIMRERKWSTFAHMGLTMRAVSSVIPIILMEKAADEGCLGPSRISGGATEKMNQ